MTDLYWTHDCKRLDFLAIRYVVEVSGPKATFFGTEFISYDLTDHGQSIVSSVDQVNLYFKTKQADALLFYTGESL